MQHSHVKVVGTVSNTVGQREVQCQHVAGPLTITTVLVLSRSRSTLPALHQRWVKLLATLTKRLAMALPLMWPLLLIFVGHYISHTRIDRFLSGTAQRKDTATQTQPITGDDDSPVVNQNDKFLPGKVPDSSTMEFCGQRPFGNRTTVEQSEDRVLPILSAVEILSQLSIAVASLLLQMLILFRFAVAIAQCEGLSTTTSTYSIMLPPSFVLALATLIAVCSISEIGLAWRSINRTLSNDNVGQDEDDIQPSCCGNTSAALLEVGAYIMLVLPWWIVLRGEPV